MDRCAPAATPPNHSTVTVLHRKPIQGDGPVIHGHVTDDLICTHAPRSALNQRKVYIRTVF
jgi:hypothetical protein